MLFRFENVLRPIVILRSRSFENELGEVEKWERLADEFTLIYLHNIGAKSNWS